MIFDNVKRKQDFCCHRNISKSSSAVWAVHVKFIYKMRKIIVASRNLDCLPKRGSLASYHGDN